ncbi:hypothetical protein GCM10007382_18240 [Salinibacterium xinjiangense]|nr:hypothetical protein GCM10007382_18240 [Salinibacterium xinjiangense]
MLVVKNSSKQRARRLADVRTRSSFARFTQAGRAEAREREVAQTTLGYESAAEGGDQFVAEELIA